MTPHKTELAFILLVTLNIQIIFSQSEKVENDSFGYSQELAMRDFAMAASLEKSDSLKKAIRYYRYVAKFDSTSEIGRLSMAKLDSVWKMEKSIFQSQLIGKWRWIWSGTNWGTENSPKMCNCQEYLEFGTDEILVIANNGIKERLPYQIEQDMDRLGTDYFILDVNKGEKKWRLRIYQEVENPYYLLERSRDANMFMTFRDEGLIPNCACGCPEKRYEKK